MSLESKKLLSRASALLCVAVVVVLLGAAPLYTQTSGIVAQGFVTNETNYSAGALMSLKQDTANEVELSNQKQATRLIGVVGDKAFLDVSDPNSNVSVVMNGAAQAMVSDLNGDIKTGDRVAASPISGVGMRATQNGLVLGVAQGDLSKAKTTARTVDGEDGKKYTVQIGLIPVQIQVTEYSVTNGSSGVVPSSLQNFADAVAGREVSPLRVLLSTLLSVLLFAAIVTLLYGAVRSSIISVGRNPLSEGALRKSMMQVGRLVLGITGFGLLIVFLILKI